jgi:integrase
LYDDGALALVNVIDLRRDGVHPRPQVGVEIVYRRKKTSKWPDSPIVKVPIPPVVVESLKAIPAAGSTCYFCERPTPTAENNISEAVRDLLEQASVKQAKDSRMTCHRFRDTAAHDWFLNPKLKIEEISQMLGHKSITITQKHYAAFDQERRKPASRKNGRCLGQAGHPRA